MTGFPKSRDEVSVARQHAVLRDLLVRRLGDRAESVLVELVPGAASTFEVRAAEGVVRIDASDGVAAASALRHYLARACAVQLDVEDRGIDDLPAVWPDLRATRVVSPWHWRYHLNYCTFGYTAAYWDWARWEREIDQMALSGVNLPLATVGFEGVWLRVLTELGLDSARAREFIGSAAFLPWTWMGCVHDHGHPMTEAEIADRVALGTRILERQRELGMTPVLPGFTGYLPEELVTGRSRTVEWMGFRNHCVDPTDPRYAEVGAALLCVQRELFGSDGFYAIDPFVEGRPPVDKAADVASYAAAVADSLAAHDPTSTWVLQGWPFSYRDDYWDAARTQAFLTAMPEDRTLVLDLWAEHDPVWQRTEAFAGRPWAWTMLHSFGGRPGLHGALDVLATEPGRLRAEPAAGSLEGIGTAMEALGSDPVVYDLFADIAWSDDIDLDRWLDDYLRRRYAAAHADARAAWRDLARISYLGGERSGPPVSVVMSRPALGVDLAPEVPLNLTTPPGTRAELAVLISAWELLLSSAHTHGSTPGLDRDIVDLGLDVCARWAAVVQQRAVAQFRAADRLALARTADDFSDLLLAMDRLADTVPAYRLDGWLGRARAIGADHARSDELEEDARRLVTSWVEPGHRLQDYAGRHWSGLLAGYYLPRWRLWFDALLEATTTGRPDQHAFAESLRSLEDAWLRSHQRESRPPRVAAETPLGAAAAVREVLSLQRGRQDAATLDA